MSINSLRAHNLPIAAVAVSFACVALLAGCKSSGGSSTTAGGSASQPVGAGTSAAAAATPAAAAAGNFKAVCPSTSEISATLGETYPAPKQTGSDGTLLCNYNNGNNNLVIEFSPVPGINGADLKGAMDGQAQAQKATDNEVPGLGDAAYEFSSTNVGGTQTVVDLLVGSEDIDLTADVGPKGVEALAHAVIGS